MRVRNEEGLTSTQILLIGGAVVIVLAISVYLAFSQPSNNSNTIGHKTTPTPSASSSASASPKASAQQNYFSIPEWQVKAPYSDSLHLTYTIEDIGGGSAIADFTSDELNSSATDCANGGAGSVERSSDQSPQPQSQYVAHVGSYYYSYNPSDFACTDDINLLNRAQQDLQNFIQNLQAAN